MTTLYGIIVSIFGSELSVYPVFMMFATVLMGSFIIYSFINIIWAIFKWLGA